MTGGGEQTVGYAMWGVLVPGLALGATVWNPAGNGISPPDAGAWGEAVNWSNGLPGPAEKAVFNVAGAAVCEVSGSFSGMQLVQGDNGDGGTLRILGGGRLSTKADWSAIGYNADALCIVESGGALDFGQHAWIAYHPGSTATLNIHGSVTVAQMVGLGWSGGDGFVHVLDGGLLALSTIHGGGDSIKQNSVLDLSGTGQLTLPGDFEDLLRAYVDAGKITGEGRVGNVRIDLATNPGFTTAMAAVPEPPPTAPNLALRRLSGAEIEVSWSKAFGMYRPEATDDLSGTGPWTPVDGAVILSSNRYSMVVTNEDMRIFRLYLAAVDNTTLHRKSMMGYQGWFSARGDGTLITDRWHHWGAGYPNITDWGIDFYPDMSEYSAEERYEPGWVLNNGETAYLYSAANPKTVDRHCRWMREYGIDGVFLQRFLGELQDSRFRRFRNQVTLNIQEGAEAHGRLFAIMYDLSGVADADLLGYLTSDWNYLVGALEVTHSPSYAHHNGKPVVSLWGLGFRNRGLTPATATAIIDYFRDEQGMTVMGGVPDSWRTLNGDSETDPAWAAVYRSFDIISPWTVGRYDSIAKIDAWRETKILPDLAAATAAGADYMPVVFPGFSWHNIHDGPLNQIPRQGGEFYWRQVYNAQRSGCTMMYTAMFDEMDEGTAMLKMAETTDDLPVGADMVPLDADGISLPSDWYLRVGGEAGRMLRGEIPLQGSVPIRP